MIIDWHHANLSILFLLNTVWEMKQPFFKLKIFLEYSFTLTFDWPFRNFPKAASLQLQICENLISKKQPRIYWFYDLVIECLVLHAQF